MRQALARWDTVQRCGTAESKAGRLPSVAWVSPPVPCGVLPLPLPGPLPFLLFFRPALLSSVALAQAVGVSGAPVMPRIRSAGVIGSWVERDRRQYNTIGISGCDSPRGREKLLALWYGLRTERIGCNPRIVVNGHTIGSLQLVYAMVFWDPEPRIRGMTRPDQWHTTLVRFSRPTPQGDDACIPTLQHNLTTLLEALRGPHQHTLLLDEPPWGTWAFGLQGESKSLCEALRSSTLHIVQHHMQITTGEQRALHVSWQ